MMGSKLRGERMLGLGLGCGLERLCVWKRHMSGKLCEERGQMMVELCVIFPVVIVIALIVVNALTFFGDCARFDRVVHNSVRIVSSSPTFSLDDEIRIAEDVLLGIENGMDNDQLEINLSVMVTAERYMQYEAELVYYPTLFGLNIRREVFGVSLPNLSHKVKYTVDPYRAGALF